MGDMSRRVPDHDIDEADLRITEPKDHAAGVPAVAVAMKRAVEQMGPVRTARALLKLNQADGFDCPGCAWPDGDPEHRHVAEFCENGAKAVAEEATRHVVGPDFFAAHPLAELSQKTDWWLGQQGRITHPMVLRPGASHYTPIAWDEAFGLVAEHLNALESPDQAEFYTSGKVSNEAAFAYQLFVRAYGTNNLPDCSNMCHESSGVGLIETIGIGKGSVHLDDLHEADLIVVIGQNPGTNHPRMLSALEEAKRRGAKIVDINPLREAGMTRFKNPQKARGLIGPGTGLADLHLPVRINGDLALLQAVGRHLVEADALDHEFITAHTVGFEDWVAQVRDLDPEVLRAATGLDEAVIEEFASLLCASEKTVWCWAMGITQHRNSVATVKEITNLALARGDIGKPGAGLCPVRGHSNVQGDRTMGISEAPTPDFLDNLAAEFGFEPPREHGHDVVASIKALHAGESKVFIAMGGNFVSASPDTGVVEEAMRRAELTVHVATKLNRSHVVHGRTALILPPLVRSEIDRTGGIEQRVTVEDSMSAVHSSRGPLKPAGDQLRSEVDIVCSMAQATLGDGHDLPWSEFRADYSRIRRSIEKVVPGAEGYQALVERREGFVLPHPPRDSRTFPTPQGKAVFTASPVAVLHVPEGRLLLQTLRSHDQFNTTIYGLDDRYRGIKGGRRVVLVHPEDIAALGLSEGSMVDLISEWPDGAERRADEFRVVGYDQPRGCAAAYYPETNPLVRVDSYAEGSRTPTYKSVVVRLEPRAAAQNPGRHPRPGE